MRVLPGGASMKGPAHALDVDAQLENSLAQHLIRQRDDLPVFDVNVAMHIPDQMRDARRLRDVARPHHQDVLVGGGHDVGRFGVVVQQLPGMENRAGWQLQRENDAVRCFDQPPNPSFFRYAIFGF